MSGWEKDIMGYVAGALVLCTFSFRSMRLLRCVGIASNISFMSYAVIAGMMPIFVLHSLLLPINVFRLIQIDHELNADNQGLRHIVPSIPAEPFSRRAGGLFGRISRGIRRSRERTELRRLCYRDLHDIGFTRVLDENAKQFWQS